MSKGGREDTYQRANGHVRSSRRLQDSWSSIVIRRRRVGDCRYAFTAVVEKRFGSWLCRAPVPSRLPTRRRASVVAANPAFSSPTSSQKKRGLRTGTWAGLENWQYWGKQPQYGSGAGLFFPRPPRRTVKPNGGRAPWHLFMGAVPV